MPITAIFLAAMSLESGALLRHLPGWKKAAAGPLRGASFELSGRRCLLVTCGMGERRAGEAARRLAEDFSPAALVSFGIAGAVEAELQIGDVILPRAVHRLEGGVPGPPLVLAAWPPAARAAASQALAARGARLLEGTAVTTPGSQVSAETLAGLPHPVLEMETCAIARAAAEKGIPFYALRAVSDGPGAPIPVDLGAIFDEDANLRPGRLLKAVLRRPGLLLQSRRVMRNSRIAAENAAAALLAAWSQVTV